MPMPMPMPMPVRRALAALLCACLAGCASSTALQAVHDFAQDANQLAGYKELSTRFRETYPRLSPYLSPQAERQERDIDAQRRAAYRDCMAIHQAVTLYLDTLAALADGRSFRLDAPLKELGSGIKAWPDTGLSDRHVNAYSGLARLLARTATTPYQERSVQAMLLDGQEQLQTLLEAMQIILRQYDKSADNERAIVLGLFDAELPYANVPQERLLAALAKSHQQARAAEYRLYGLRNTLAAQHLAATAAAHRALLAYLAQPTDAAARDALDQARGALRAASLAPMPGESHD